MASALIRFLRWLGGLTLLLIVVFVITLLGLLLLGFISPLVFVLLLLIGIPLLVALAILATPIAILALVIPFAILLAVIVIISMLLSLILSLTFTIITLWAADMAFAEVLGVKLLPLREDGSIIWWRVAFAILLFISIYTLISRLLILRIEARREAGYRHVW